MATTTQVETRKRGFFGWIFLIAFWLFNAFMAFCLFAGLSDNADQYKQLSTEAERAGHAIGTTLGVGMILGIWVLGAILLGLMVMMTRGKKIIKTFEG